MDALDFLRQDDEKKKDSVSFLYEGSSASEFLKSPSLAGADLPTMPYEGPEKRPAPMNQAKVYGMLEGMPSELATEIKKAAILYDEYGTGSMKMPPVSLPRSLLEGFQNIPNNIKDIAVETSSMVMLVGKGLGGMGKSIIHDLNETYSYLAKQQVEGAKTDLPDYETIDKGIEIAKKIPSVPGQIYDFIEGQVDRAKDIGEKRYLYNIIENRPVDVLLVGNALRAALGKGARISIKGVGRIAQKGSRVADKVDDILSTQRVPIVYKMPVEIGKKVEFDAYDTAPFPLKVTAKDIKFQRAYSEDPLVKYAMQKSFDKVLNKYPDLEQKLGAQKAGSALTKMRQAYDSASVRERIALHRDIDQMLGTLSKDELDVAVRYLEGRASLINEPSEQFAKFESWYRGLMSEQKETVGLKDVDNVLYGPIAKITGQTVDEIKKDLGDFTPAYVHQMHEAFPKKMSVEFTDTTGKRFAPGILKKRMRGEGYSEDLKKIMPKWASEYVKYKNTQAFIQEFTDKYGIPVNLKDVKDIGGKLKVGNKTYDGYRIIAPDGMMRFYKGEINFYKEVSKKLDELDLDEAIGTTIRETVGDVKETTRVLGGVEGEMSRQAKMIEDRVREALSSRGFASGESEQMIRRIKSEGLDGIRETITEKEFTKLREVIITTGVDPKKIKDAFRQTSKSYIGVSKNQKVYLVPEEQAKNLESWAVPRFGSQKAHNFLKIAYDKPVGVWKDSVLALTPRWMKNNVMGDILFNIMEGVGLLSYGRAFSAKYIKLIPDRLLGASFAEVMKYNPKLGMAAKNSIGKLMKGLGETAPIRGMSKFKDTMYALNTSFEQPFVRSLYVKIARDKAKQLLKARKVPINEKSILYKMEEIKNSPSLHNPLIEKVRQTLPVFDLSGNFERKYMKMMMPFYNWYKFMGQYAARLPKNHPFKTVGARGLGALSEIERETAFKQMMPFMGEDIEENGIPNRFDNMWPVSGPDKNGEYVFFNARGMNPFTTIEDFVEGDVVNMMSPIIKLFIEQGTGKEAFTGRDYKLGEQGRDVAKGKFREFEKETPPLFDHIASQFPQYTLLKQMLVPAKQWDSGTVFNPDPILDKITGEYKYPIKNIEKALNYMGIDRKTLDVRRSWDQYQKNRDRAIGETFKKIQSKYDSALTREEIKGLMDFIKSKPEQWERISRRIKENAQQRADEQKELNNKIRGN